MRKIELVVTAENEPESQILSILLELFENFGLLGLQHKDNKSK